LAQAFGRNLSPRRSIRFAGSPFSANASFVRETTLAQHAMSKIERENEALKQRIRELELAAIVSQSLIADLLEQAS
jgi:hypothetical protein